MPLFIAGQDMRTSRQEDAISPHDHRRVLGAAHLAGEQEIRAAITAAVDASHDWARTPWQERATVFLKAADLLAGPWRDRLNAATMLGQSKTVHQAEIDSACELIDFLRFNVVFMQKLYSEQPLSSPGRVESRRLPAARSLRICAD